MKTREKINKLLEIIIYLENEDIYSKNKRREKLLDEFINVRDQVLFEFGLKPTLKNTKLFDSLLIWDSTSIEELHNKLKQTAFKYHKSPVYTEKELLILFYNNKIDYTELLTELGFSLHCYNIFLSKIFKENKIISSVFINCLYKANTNETLNNLGILIYSSDQKEIDDLNEKLKFIGYIDEYINYYKNGK